jgi:hypothetical protein
VEDRVNVPRDGEFQLGGDRGYEFRDGEGSGTFWRQFDRSVGYRKVLSF